MTHLELPPLGLYIHLPWCVRKCPYCDFNSHGVGDHSIPEQDYVEQLAADMQSQAGWAQGRHLQTIFFGGGTPSLFSAAAIAQILQTAERTFGFAADIEITLEANPGTFEQEKFSGYRAAGVNRLSIGVQSFDPLQLSNLGRIHSSDEARVAVGVAREAGFDNINLDLMHALPGQSTVDALRDLDTAIALGVPHISWYQLTIEPNTEFYRHPPKVPADERVIEMQATGRARLAEAGYPRYEISAYAQPGQRARHNINYWSFGDYIGVGAGAHGKITLPDGNRVGRTQRTRHPRHYLSASMHLPELKLVSEKERPLEFLMNALRLVDGVPAKLFPSATGLPLSALEPQWRQLQAQGLAVAGSERLAATPEGFDFVDEMLTRYL
ncbi:radical SAM family heme chaperone HemW [Biformimicrobium ophioploci]|uniref:Heme chaperone HemW n=1 Tax=Biformimicrobium ophioploci TaxID=3036711 RepID=A0ABQ6LV53_9GAMM|nr:radical SAM family heme chaperone HemW [Microbulbifer sp. NKW57]GMG85926.1 radical SAM family heme chaperone HemW [Microbulbifer sp. NKW57]